MLLLQRANFLILDEPTNHLDIAAREALEEMLDEFDGTILFVSHDRYFIDRIATQSGQSATGSWPSISATTPITSARSAAGRRRPH